MNKGRVAMLMSGGVDSSVAAALLKQQGHEVLGFYILGWLGIANFPCSWQKEENDARVVANQLGIPFYTINLSRVYEEEVIDRFFAGYQAGVTPNPDILCNREIKFKALWRSIRQFECDFLASGHYARCQQTAVSYQPSADKKAESRALKADSFGIFKPKDSDKDQTYFLWGIDKVMLSKIIFPLGNLTKQEVRQLAEKYKLPNANKKDSQGICFIGPLKIRQFLASRIKTRFGDVCLADGRKIATHKGVQFYTIGQRLAAGSVAWTGDVPPLFVVAKDVEHNRLIVGSDGDTFGSNLVARDLNWLNEPAGKQFVVLAKIRYRQDDVAVNVRKNSRFARISRRRAAPNDHEIEVEFVSPVRAITPGQSIVFYSQDGQLLGGGIVHHNKSK